MKYRKKPVVVEAFQMTKECRMNNIDWPMWLHMAWNIPYDEVGSLSPKDYPNSDGTDELIIATLEGKMKVSFDDWIILGVHGEIYPCKPDIFQATYELVQD